jgi:hypothetical protein
MKHKGRLDFGWTETKCGNGYRVDTPTWLAREAMEAGNFRVPSTALRCRASTDFGSNWWSLRAPLKSSRQRYEQIKSGQSEIPVTSSEAAPVVGCHSRVATSTQTPQSLRAARSEGDSRSLRASRMRPSVKGREPKSLAASLATGRQRVDGDAEAHGHDGTSSDALDGGPGGTEEQPPRRQAAARKSDCALLNRDRGQTLRGASAGRKI